MFQMPAQFLSEIVGWLRRLEQPGGGREKRRSTRVIVCARVTVTELKSGGEITAMTRDFSAGGLGLMQSLAAAKGETFDVTLPRAREGPLRVRCKVTYASQLADGVWGVGAQFTSIVTVAVKPDASSSAKSVSLTPLSPKQAEAKRIQRQILS
jgi:hypothetical protein